MRFPTGTSRSPGGLALVLGAALFALFLFGVWFLPISYGWVGFPAGLFLTGAIGGGILGLVVLATVRRR